MRSNGMKVHMDEYGIGPGRLGDDGAREICPAWCVTAHGTYVGEEDWLHISEPLVLADGTLAKLCMSIDPSTGIQDGPFVLIGSTEYSLEEAEDIGAALMAMADLGSSPIGASAS